MITARLLIDEAFDVNVESLACDFVEVELGRFFYGQSWKRNRNRHIEHLRQWLEANGNTEKHSGVVALIDQWSELGMTWNDRWNSDYGTGEKPKSVKPKSSQKHADTVRTGRQSQD